LPNNVDCPVATRIVHDDNRSHLWRDTRNDPRYVLRLILVAHPRGGPTADDNEVESARGVGTEVGPAARKTASLPT
jgi:hypothetical protein